MDLCDFVSNHGFMSPCSMDLCHECNIVMSPCNLDLCHECNT